MFFFSPIGGRYARYVVSALAPSTILLPQLVFLFFPVTWIGERKRKGRIRNETKRIVTFSRAQPRGGVVPALLTSAATTCTLHIVHNNIHTYPEYRGGHHSTYALSIGPRPQPSKAHWKEDYCFPPLFWSSARQPGQSTTPTT